MRAIGVNVKKVLVDTEEMLRWANENNRLLDSEARTEYVTFVLRSRAKGA